MKSISLCFALMLGGVVCVSAQEGSLVVAHRGASETFPENTLEAFAEAFRLEADAIEADFRLTADGVVVCIHDEDTERVGDRDLKVEASTYAELQRVNVGAYRGKEAVRIPTFAEVAASVPADKFFYIEVKGGVGMLPALFREIRASELNFRQLRLISFDPEVIRRGKELEPEIKAYWLVSRKRNVVGRVQPGMKEIIRTAKDIGADGVSGKYRFMGPEEIQNLREAGFEFHVWTVNDPELAKKFLDAGTGSVTTKDPSSLKDLLR
jgi:glycerophosphoryl diester phosphodiesterase